MLLREFELDLREAESGVRADFCRRTRFVSALYARGFPSSRGPDAVRTRGWKICVECVPVRTARAVVLAGGVYSPEVVFDYERFVSLAEADWPRMVLDALHTGALAVAESELISSRPFENAREFVLEHNFVNEWIWSKPVSSPSRRLRAHLACRQTSKAFTAWLTVTDKLGRVLERVEAVDTGPHEFQYLRRLGAVRWTTDARVVMLDRDGREVVRVDTGSSC